MASIVEKYKDELLKHIKVDIERQKPFILPNVLQVVYKMPSLKAELLQKYETDTCKGKSIQEMGITEDIALMQAVLNDTVIISGDGKLYTNNAPEMISVDIKYKREASNIVPYNRSGVCKAFRITTGHAEKVENGVGIIRTRETFINKFFCIYPVYRSYFEYLLEWAKTGGVLLQAEEGNTVYDVCFSFSDTIKNRYELPIQRWDLNHEPLEDDDDIFDARKAVFDRSAGKIKVYTSNDYLEEILLNDRYVITPVDEEKTTEIYGKGYLDKYNSVLLTDFIDRTQNENEDFQVSDSEKSNLDTLLNYTNVYLRDLEYLRYTITDFDRYMRPVDNFVLKETINPSEVDKYLKKNLLFIIFEDGYSSLSGLYTRNKIILRDVYGSSLTKKRTQFERNCKSLLELLNKGSIPEDYRDYLSEEELGGHGFDSVMNLLDAEEVQTNVFTEATLKAYTITDGYLDSNKCTEQFAVYLPIEHIKEARICEKRVSDVSKDNDCLADKK